MGKLGMGVKEAGDEKEWGRRERRKRMEVAQNRWKRKAYTFDNIYTCMFYIFLFYFTLVSSATF